MGELISQEELDRAFDARFPKEMQVKLRSAKVEKNRRSQLLQSRKSHLNRKYR